MELTAGELWTRILDAARPGLSQQSFETWLASSSPTPVSRIAAERQVACQVSLETPMACGIGICFTCVAKVIGDDGEWDYKRTCVEGPVFDAAKIDWS